MVAQATDVQSDDQDFVALLDKELESACLPQCNAKTSEPDDLIRDLHTIIGGNGGPTRGLVFKMAAANVNVSLLRTRVAVIAQRVTTQEDLCAAQHQAMAQVAAEAAGRKKFLVQLWDNRAVILVLLLTAVTFFNVHSPSKAPSDIQMQGLLKKNLEIVLGAKLPARVTDNAPNNSGPTPRK